MDELASRDVVSRAMAARDGRAGCGPPSGWTPPGWVRVVERFPNDRRVVWATTGWDPANRLAADCPRRPTIFRGGWSPTCGARLRCQDCGPLARWHAPGFTAPTGSHRTRCSRAWCTGRGFPSASRADTGSNRHGGDGAGRRGSTGGRAPGGSPSGALVASDRPRPWSADVRSERRLVAPTAPASRRRHPGVGRPQRLGRRQAPRARAAGHDGRGRCGALWGILERGGPLVGGGGRRAAIRAVGARTRLDRSRPTRSR